MTLGIPAKRIDVDFPYVNHITNGRKQIVNNKLITPCKRLAMIWC